MPVVKFSTSDVRNSSATLVAGYRLANRKDSFFTMVSPLKVDHRRSKVDGLTEFEGAVSRLYARFRDTEETIQAMSQYVDSLSAECVYPDDAESWFSEEVC